MKNKIAFDDSTQKWVVFYTTDRIDYDFETGQQLEPIMCDYHTVAECDDKEKAQSIADDLNSLDCGLNHLEKLHP